MQNWDDQGNYTDVDQTTTVDAYGDVQVDTETVQEDADGGYNVDYQEDTYVNEGDGEGYADGY